MRYNEIRAIVFLSQYPLTHKEASKLEFSFEKNEFFFGNKKTCELKLAAGSTLDGRYC